MTGSATLRQVVEELVGYVLRDLRLAGRRLRVGRGRRLRGRGGAVLHVDTRRARGGARRGRGAAGGRVLGRHRRRELRGPVDPQPAARPWPAGPAGRDRGAAGGAVRGAVDAGPARPRRQGADRVERPVRRRPGRSRRAPSGAPTGSTRRRQAGDFLLGALRRDDGRWLRSWQGDEAVAAAVGRRCSPSPPTTPPSSTPSPRLYEATGRARWLAEAIAAADALLDLFWDEADGGVFTTGHDAERLVARQKDLLDNATPSATSLTANGLLRLAALTGVDRYRERAEDLLRILGPVAAKHPLALPHLLAAVDLSARRHRRDRRHRRPARPARRRACGLAPAGGPRLGGAVRLPAVGGPPRRRQGLRLPRLRLRAPRSTRRTPSPPHWRQLTAHSVDSCPRFARRVRALMTILPVFSPVNMALRASTADSRPVELVGAVAELALGDPAGEHGGDLGEPAPVVEGQEAAHAAPAAGSG